MANKLTKSKKKVSSIRQERIAQAKAGEAYHINDKKTRGHISIITRRNKADRKNEVFRKLTITHAEKTKKTKNIDLQENPDIYDEKKSRVLPKVNEALDESIGKKRDDIKIKNPIDKAIFRYLKKKDKKEQKKR